MPKKKPEQRCEGPDFEVGTEIEVIRPHLFAGHYGTVLSVKDHKHRVELYKGDRTFQVEVCGSELKQIE